MFKLFRQSEKGFTIVELLVSIIALGIVSGSIIGLFLTIQQTQIGSHYLETATRAAQREVETLRNRDYLNLTPGEEIDFTGELPDSLPQERSGTVMVSEPLEGLRRVDVRVTYNHAGSERVVELSSLIGVIGITQ